MNKITYIADLSSNHECNLQTALDSIKIAKECGIDIFKIQHWVTDKFINKEAFDNLKIGHQKKWNKSVYDIYKQYEVPLDWIPKLKEECDKNEIEFMVTPYDIDSIDFIDNYVKRWKIGSGDIDYIPLLEKIANKNKEIFLGCGSSTRDEIIKAKYFILGNVKFNNKIVLFQCNTNYSNNDDNLKYIDIYNIKQLQMHGLSDHTKSDIPILLSISNGVRYIERHFKIKDNNSPDNDFSMNPKEWKRIIKIGNQAIKCLQEKEKIIMDNEIETRCIQRRDKNNWMRPDMIYYNKYIKV